MNLAICMGYIIFGNIIDSIENKKGLTLFIEFLLVVGFGILALMELYECCDSLDQGRLRLKLVLSFLSGHVEIMTLYMIVSWFTRHSTVIMLALLNTAFLVMSLQMFVQVDIVYSIMSGLIFLIFLIDAATFTVHPLYVRAAVELE